jgi:hypothetical protein
VTPPERPAPAGWERFADGHVLAGVWVAELPDGYGRVYADSTRGEVEFGGQDCYRLSPADARAFAARLIEAADLAEGRPAP